MKKFISILLFALVLSLVGCSSPSDDAPINHYTQEEVDVMFQTWETDFVTVGDYIDELEQRLDTAEAMLINLRLDVDLNKDDIVLLKERVNGVEGDFASLGYIDGLNGQRSYYTSSTSGMSNMSSVFLASELDKTKLPLYLFDIEGNAVDFDYLGEALKLKYFGQALDTNDMFSVGYRTSLNIYLDGTLSKEDIVVRTYAMLEELSMYDYWLIGTSELLVYIVTPTETYIVQVYMPSFRSVGFNLTLEDYHLENWEIYKTFDFDLVVAQALYDQYVIDETFINYVLVIE